MNKKSIRALLLLLVCLTLSAIISVPTMAAKAKKPKKPKIISVKEVSPTAIQVSWKKAKNAKKYEIYYSVNGAKFKKLKTLKKRSFKHTGLKQGNTYAYKVRAVNGKKKSAFSAVKKLLLGWADGTELQALFDGVSLPAATGSYKIFNKETDDWDLERPGSGTITSIKARKYHNTNAKALSNISYVFEICGKEHPYMAQDGARIVIGFYLARSDGTVSKEEVELIFGRNMKEDPDGHKVEYTVDSKGNFKCKWYQKDGTLFADYDRIVVNHIANGVSL